MPPKEAKYKAPKAQKAPKLPEHPEARRIHEKIRAHQHAIARHEDALADVIAQHENDLKLRRQHKDKKMDDLLARELRDSEAFLKAKALAEAYPSPAALEAQDRAAKRLSATWRAIRGKTYVSTHPDYRDRKHQMDHHRGRIAREISSMNAEYAKLART